MLPPSSGFKSKLIKRPPWRRQQPKLSGISCLNNSLKVETT
jgi:hypothetical protein